MPESSPSSHTTRNILPATKSKYEPLSDALVRTLPTSIRYSGKVWWNEWIGEQFLSKKGAPNGGAKGWLRKKFIAQWWLDNMPGIEISDKDKLWYFDYANVGTVSSISVNLTELYIGAKVSFNSKFTRMSTTALFVIPVVAIPTDRRHRRVGPSSNSALLDTISGVERIATNTTRRLRSGRSNTTERSRILANYAKLALMRLQRYL